MFFQRFIKKINQLNKKTNTRILFHIGFILFNLAFVPQLFFNPIYFAPHDVDRKSNGNTLICAVGLNEMIAHIPRIDYQMSMPRNTITNRIIEVDENGNKVWEFSGLALPHEIVELPNGNLLVADTNFDRVIEIDYNQKKIIWSWKPSQINWTKVNSDWDGDHYYNNPRTYDWTHINDVDFKEYGTWNACLVSLRNFDLVVEINYTAESENPNNPDNINWWYGDYLNHSLLFQQHNPDYLQNGNIIIADSENNRIVEINYSTKERVWESSLSLRWPRDADELDNGNLLITDSYNNRIIEINKTTEDILWSFSKDVIIPYEADLLKEGTILVSEQFMGHVLEVKRDGTIVWAYGISFYKPLFYFNALMAIGIFILEVFYRSQNVLNPKLSQRKKRLNISLLGFFSTMIVLFLSMLICYNGLLKGFVQFLNPIIK